MGSLGNGIEINVILTRFLFSFFILKLIFLTVFECFSHGVSIQGFLGFYPNARRVSQYLDAGPGLGKGVPGKSSIWGCGNPDVFIC